jgi:hypothetical protein
VLVEREPQFVTLAADHPAAARREIRLADLAGERWMIDSTVDGEWDALSRALRSAGVEPEMLHGDYLTAYSLAAMGEVVTVSQPTAQPRPDLAVRPLQGDPIGVRLLLAARTETELDRAFRPLEEAYWEVARQSPVYQRWLEDRRTERDSARAHEAGPVPEAEAPHKPGRAGAVRGSGPLRQAVRRAGPAAVPAAVPARGPGGVPEETAAVRGAGSGREAPALPTARQAS